MPFLFLFKRYIFRTRLSLPPVILGIIFTLGLTGCERNVERSADYYIKNYYKFSQGDPEFEKMLHAFSAARDDPQVRKHLWDKLLIRIDADSYLDLMDDIFGKKPMALENVISLEPLVRIIQVKGRTTARKWIENYANSEQVTTAYIRILDNTSDNRPSAEASENVVHELADMRTVVTDDLAQAIARAALESGSEVLRAYIDAGLPPSGMPLGRVDPGTHHDLPPIDARVDRAGTAYFEKVLEYKYRNTKYAGELDSALGAIGKRLPAARGAIVDGAIRGLWMHPDDLNFVDPVLELGDEAPGLVQDWITAHPDAELQETARRTVNLIFELYGGQDWAKAHPAAKLREAAELMAVFAGARPANALDLVADWVRQNYTSDAQGRVGRNYQPRIIEYVRDIFRRSALGDDPSIRQLLTDEHWALQLLGVRILADKDPRGLADSLNELLDSGRFDGMRDTATPEPGWLTDHALKDALEQLQPAAEIQSVRHFWLRLLSNPSKDIRIGAVNTLRQALDVNAFVDGLFAFVVAKSQFNQQEVDSYLAALNSFEGIEKAITGTLGNYLAQSGGKSEKVFWLLKVLSIQVLNKHGDEASIPVLMTLAHDSGRFYVVETTLDPQSGEKKVEREEKTFAEESRRAIAAIRSRSRP